MTFLKSHAKCLVPTLCVTGRNKHTNLTLPNSPGQLSSPTVSFHAHKTSHRHTEIRARSHPGLTSPVQFYGQRRGCTRRMQRICFRVS